MTTVTCCNCGGEVHISQTLDILLGQTEIYVCYDCMKEEVEYIADYNEYIEQCHKGIKAIPPWQMEKWKHRRL